MWPRPGAAAGTMVAEAEGMLPTNNSRTLLAVLALLGLLSSGCAARVYGRGYVGYAAPVVFVAAPQLVYVGPGLYVVRDYDEAVYYSDGYYWCQRGDVWYQTAYWSDPWVTVHVSAVPTTFVHAHHHSYVHYHGAAGAPVYDAPPRDYHAASPHAVAAVDHGSPPPAPQGAGAIRRSGPASHAPSSGQMTHASSSRPVPQPSGGAYSGSGAGDFRQPAPPVAHRSPGNAQPVSSHRASPPAAAHSRPQPAPAPARSQPAPRHASAPSAPPPSRASAPAARKQPASTPAPSRSKSRKSSDKPSRS